MDPILVRCSKCARTWHSRTMADGLRAIGSCPRCGGTLEWAAGDVHPAPEVIVAAGESQADTGGVAPHLVLGLPRREF